MGLSKEKKAAYFDKMETLIRKYAKLFVVNVDNVGSNQMQQIRYALRDLDTVILMGKNTMMRKIVAQFCENNPGHPIEALMPLIKGNIGFVFTNSSLTDVREVLQTNVVPAPARVGAIAPIDVTIPPGPTDSGPEQTGFFQTLQIATKIVKGKIEITAPVELLKKGDKVGNSEAVLLQKLDIKPFSYGIVLEAIYDGGSIFSPAVLDITDEILAGAFQDAAGKIASLGLACGYPTLASVPHSINNAFRTLVSIAIECDAYTFDKAEEFRKALKMPAVKFDAGGAKPAAEAEGGEEPAAPAAGGSDY